MIVTPRTFAGWVNGGVGKSGILSKHRPMPVPGAYLTRFVQAEKIYGMGRGRPVQSCSLVHEVTDGPLPWTFDYEPQTHSIIAVKGPRQNWHPKLVRVDVAHDAFLHRPPFEGLSLSLASAFHVSGIDYYWQRGEREPVSVEAGNHTHVNKGETQPC